MVAKIVSGHLGRVVYAHLEPDEDVYDAIMEVAISQEIKAGVVMAVTGALAHTTLSMPGREQTAEQPPGLFEAAGTAEALGSGYIGMTSETWRSPDSGIEHLAGEPFMHVHLSVSVEGVGYTGHLIRGCKVRSLHPKSHFVVVIGEVHGVDLTFHGSDVITDAYPQGLPYYDLASAYPS